MRESICCVCHQPVGLGGKVLGGRHYCAEHYDRVTRDRPGLWQAGLAQIAGLLLFVAIVEIVVSLAKPQLEGVALLAVSVILAVVPALLWLAFFYRQDRLEPEPRGYVLGVFVLGALVAGAVGLPILNGVFRTSTWLGHSTAVNILGSILTVGFTTEFLKYATVRYSVYALPEFDERVDGIIYGTAAGLGFATALNIQYVLQSGGVDLRAGIIRVVITALAQASLGGITGYFLGHAKFEHEPIWWLPAGVSLAAVLNGLFTYLRGEVTRTGISLTSGGGYNPWPSLWLATALSIVVFLALNMLIRRANRLTLSQAATGSQTATGGEA